MKIEVEFDSGFESGKPVPITVGRLVVGRYHVVRIFFSADGKLRIALPQEAVDDGSVLLTKRSEELIGFIQP